MKRTSYLFMFLVGLSVALLTLLPEKPLQAISPDGCLCAGGFYTPEFHGAGATCDQAKASISAQAAPYVDCYGETVCRKSLVITVACHLCDDGQIMAHGYVSYVCWICP